MSEEGDLDGQTRLRDQALERLLDGMENNDSAKIQDAAVRLRAVDPKAYDDILREIRRIRRIVKRDRHV